MTQIRVALVEDHDLTRMGLRVALQQKGFDFVGEAATGAQGLRLIQTTQPDVAIIDIGLPDLDGIELTRQLKEALPSDPDPQIRVLILTMHDSEEAVMAAFAAGADSYCMKDVQSDRLILAVEETSQGNSWIDPAIAGIVLGRIQYPGSGGKGEPRSRETAMEVEPEHRQPTIELDSHPLTERELEVLEMIVAGQSNALIAENLYITIGTVKTHVRSILNKLSVDDRTQAAVQALRSGLIQL